MRRSTTYRRAELCREALEVIELRFAEEALTLQVVAVAIATSGRQLQRVLADPGGTTFRRELLRVRMEHAATMLHDGSHAVKDVAAAVGYRSATQFTRTFHRHHGATPTTFQKGVWPAPRAEPELAAAGR